MPLTHCHRRGLLATFLIATLTFGAAIASAEQRRGPSGGGGGNGGSGGGGHTPSGGSERVGTATPRSGGSGGGTRSDGGNRSDGSTTSGETSQPAPTRARASGGSDGKSGDSGETAHSRPRNGAPVVGRAEPRGGGWPGSGGGTTVIVPGGWYYPWGYGGYGFAGYYGGYDPWYYDDPYAYGSFDEGSVRLKVKPRDASVFVDGYFAGQVDDFDGVFQRLRLDSGPHRIEVSLEGYEPLSFEVRVPPDRTITYEGELRRLQ
jgi:PEGA domain